MRSTKCPSSLLVILFVIYAVEIIYACTVCPQNLKANYSI